MTTMISTENQTKPSSNNTLQFSVNRIKFEINRNLNYNISQKICEVFYFPFIFGKWN